MTRLWDADELARREREVGIEPLEDPQDRPLFRASAYAPLDSERERAYLNIPARPESTLERLRAVERDAERVRRDMRVNTTMFVCGIAPMVITLVLLVLVGFR